jgi:hypothetical protein
LNDYKVDWNNGAFQIMARVKGYQPLGRIILTEIYFQEGWQPYATIWDASWNNISVMPDTFVIDSHTN